MSWAAHEGLPYPLGVSWCARDRAYNFALYSKHATAVSLVLFRDGELATPRHVFALAPRANKSGRVWHHRVPEAIVDACHHYGYVIDGPEPTAPFELHAFHPDRVLVDPYARCIDFPPDRGPLGRILARAPAFDWGDDPRPRHEADAVIYELHVRGFTRHASSGVPASTAGTFAGVVDKIPYLRELGVTIVELMPVFQFDPRSRDFWGYMPVGFFAPHAAYAPPGESPIDAFRAMVAALHRADIEVVIDVVYNHTAEGGVDGPVYNFKGIDNSTYYLMRDGTYANYSGCGNSLNANNRYVRKMILDSMRYWVREMHVDGFRFDLASVFARSPDGSVQLDDPAIFGDIASDPLFDGIRMIAEPWDADGAYALGRAFPGITWLQWNGRFRDDVRSFVDGTPDLGALIQRIYGSDDLFPDDTIGAYHAYQSVNYVTSHDGLTLFDLASSPARAKMYVALLLLANGTPMIRGGDELLQTQGGNPNPYDQDNETTWLDWRGRERHPGFWRFVQRMIAFRRRHPSIARSRFWRDDVRWYGSDGVVDYATAAVAWCLRGGSHGDDDLYAIVNTTAEPITFVVQDTERPWARAVDTALADPDDVELDTPRALAHPSYTAAPHSVVVLVRPPG